MNQSIKGKIKQFSKLRLSSITGTSAAELSDILSLQKLNKVFASLKKVYPYSSSALDPTSLNMVVNDIIVNNRKHIFELGSGISSIVIAKLIELNELDVNFYSIDSDPNWTSFIKNCLIHEGISDNCELIYAPTTEASGYWYDEKIIESVKTRVKTIDCLIIDGPIAYSSDRQLSRAGALKNLKDILAEDRSVFLHDAQRTGEKSVLKDWESNYQIEFDTIGRVAVHLHGAYFNIH